MMGTPTWRTVIVDVSIARIWYTGYLRVSCIMLVVGGIDVEGGPEFYDLLKFAACG